MVAVKAPAPRHDNTGTQHLKIDDFWQMVVIANYINRPSWGPLLSCHTLYAARHVWHLDGRSIVRGLGISGFSPGEEFPCRTRAAQAPTAMCPSRFSADPPSETASNPHAEHIRSQLVLACDRAIFELSASFGSRQLFGIDDLLLQAMSDLVAILNAVGHEIRDCKDCREGCAIERRGTASDANM